MYVGSLVATEVQEAKNNIKKERPMLSFFDMVKEFLNLLLLLCHKKLAEVESYFQLQKCLTYAIEKMLPL